MLPLLPVLVGLIGVIIIALIYLSARPEVTRVPGGKVLAFLLVFLAPGLALFGGATAHLERSKTTQFCLSCHVMHDFGQSLHVDDPSYIPAKHFQNNLVPRDRACYTCHTDYAMFGTVHAKLRGLRHLYVQYLGKTPKPEEIKLYTPFNNRECLHCHLGMRVFEEQAKHNKTPEMMRQIVSNQMSCTTSKCHDTVHDVASLKDATFWKGAQ